MQLCLLKQWELWVILELESICLLRAVVSEDGMTANVFKFPHEFMEIVSLKNC